MNTKKLLCGSLSFLMSLTLTACSSSKAETGENTETEDKTEETAEEGWKVNGSYSQLISGDDRDLFDQTLASDNMKDHDPVAVLADQVVSGTNVAYLAFNTEKAPGYWEVAVIYKDAEGKSQFTNTAELNPDSLEFYTVTETPADLLGGWNYRSSGKPGALSEDGEAALSAAVEKTDLTLMPVALLGSDAGTGEYLFVCYGTKDDKNVVYIVTVKNEEITDTRILDLGKIVQPENKE